jgi:hypothetical protein
MTAAGSKMGVGSGVGVDVGGGNGVGVEVGGCGVGDETGSGLDVATVVAVGSGVSPLLSAHATTTVSSATSTTSSLILTLSVPRRFCIWESVS